MYIYDAKSQRDRCFVVLCAEVHYGQVYETHDPVNSDQIIFIFPIGVEVVAQRVERKFGRIDEFSRFEGGVRRPGHRRGVLRALRLGPPEMQKLRRVGRPVHGVRRRGVHPEQRHGRGLDCHWRTTVHVGCRYAAGRLITSAHS